jgi:hypothetical protein
VEERKRKGEHMRRIKRTLAVPIILILDLLKIVINLLIKAECWVAGVGFLLLAILSILAIISRQWLQVGIFAGMAGTGVILLFLSANIQVGIRIALEKLQ